VLPELKRMVFEHHDMSAAMVLARLYRLASNELIGVLNDNTIDTTTCYNESVRYSAIAAFGGHGNGMNALGRRTGFCASFLRVVC
jgi:hypothetical protein